MSDTSHSSAGLITVHIILQAHLDPVWLWPWQDGLDALLATCRSACDRLDANPDIFFTRGEAWGYWQIEQVDPELFQRIRVHVTAGRWEIVGGWWLQPDCNLPGAQGMRRQIQLGKDYFLERFGQFPQTGYNVDSFGHMASLPTIMHAAGQRHYIMMRPQEHEMPLPSRLFRWREKPGAPEITTFRIARAYCTPGDAVPEGHIQTSLAGLPDGIRHTMCFVGVGDHGGGPTERLLAWCREHRDSIPGCRLQFSTVQKFFDAVAADASLLPLHTGELQHHAVGCYSVHRSIKLAVRRSEDILTQAEFMLQDAKSPSDAALNEAWRDVCFGQFHDTLGGTCVPSAYPQVLAQLGRAFAAGDHLLHNTLRRRLTLLPGDPLQRLVFFNASDEPFDDYVEIEPWLNWQPWQSTWRLLDEQGGQVPYQRIETEALACGLVRLLLRLSAAPGEMRVLRIERVPAAVADTQSPAVPASDLATGNCVVSLTSRQMRLGGLSLPLPSLQLIADPTDTWSHGTDRYDRQPLATFTPAESRVVDDGPLMSSLVETGCLAGSRIHAEYRVLDSLPYIELLLRVLWTESRKVLKLSLSLPGGAVHRFDGIPAGALERPLSGKECPFADWTLITLGNNQQIAVVSSDVFAFDAAGDELRLTLLRSPYMAHHLPHDGRSARSTVADQGEHQFHIRFFAGAHLTPASLQAQACCLRRPLLTATLTRGMPTEVA